MKYTKKEYNEGKVKLERHEWVALKKIKNAGHEGTNLYRGYPAVALKLRGLGLTEKRQDRDGIRLEFATTKGRWWSHWHEMEFDAKQRGEKLREQRKRPQQLMLM